MTEIEKLKDENQRMKKLIKVGFEVFSIIPLNELSGSGFMLKIPGLIKKIQNNDVLKKIDANYIEELKYFSNDNTE